ncbi:MAG: hypothetical protein VX938_08240 [Myxococcota bacterium]|nr:hypothetical protein [Myxococcota bacterium]
MALPDVDGHWFLETVPSPPEPGQPVELHAMYQGTTPSFQAANVSLFVNGTSVPWAYTDEGLLKRVAVMDLAPDEKSLDVTLYPLDMPPEATWTVPTGIAYDSRWCRVSPYPYRIHGGITEYWEWAVYLTGIRGKPASTLLSGLSLERADGTEMESSKAMGVGSVRRVRALLSEEALAGTEFVTLRDSAGHFSFNVPAPEVLTMEQAVDVMGPVGGGLVRWRVVGGGDIVPVMLALKDSDGQVMPPEPDLVTFEVDGGEITQELDLLPGGYNMQTMLSTGPGEGPGEVRVLALDGRILSRFPFERRAPGLTPVSVQNSNVTLLEATMVAPEGATHQVIIVLRTDFGETILADASVDIQVEGGVLMVGEANTEMDPEMMGDMGMGGMDMGSMSGGGLGSGSMMGIKADPGKHPLVVTVTANGTLFPVMSMDVDVPLPIIPPEPPAPEEPEEEDLEPELRPEPRGETMEAEAQDTVSASGGCSGGSQPGQTALLWALFLLTIWRRRFVPRIAG